MRFLHPEILWALAAVAVPIIIHLFNFRRYKKIAFSNVAFLKEVKSETTKASKLKNLLILITRILAITAIVMAFAQPFFPTATSEKMKGIRVVSIYVDNSYSMQAQKEGVPALEWSKEKALGLIRSFSSNDRFQIITNQFSGNDQRLLTQEEASQIIQEIQFTANPRSVSQVFTRQKDFLSKNQADIRLVFWLSDFQKTTTDFAEIQADSTFHFTALPVELETKNNIGIDSVYFSSQQRLLNTNDTMHVVVRNYSQQPAENISLTIELDGVQKAVSTLDLAPGETKNTAVSFSTTSTGYHYGKASISDFPMNFDNSLYFAYGLSETIQVVHLTGSEFQPVKQLFDGDAHFALAEKSINALIESDLNGKNLALVQGATSFSPEQIGWLVDFVERGGNLFIVPSSQAQLQSYNDLLGRLNNAQLGSKVKQNLMAQPIDTKNAFFAPAFEHIQNNASLPQSAMHYPLNNPNYSATPLMTWQDNSPLLASATYGKGRSWICSVSSLKSESTFPSHALFPVALIRAAESSVQETPLYYVTGKSAYLQCNHVPSNSEGLMQFKALNSSNEFVANARTIGTTTDVYFPEEMKEEGHFTLLDETQPILPIAMNYTRGESALDYYNPDELKSLASQSGLVSFDVEEASAEVLQNLATQLGGGITLWYYLVIAALIFLALEIVWIKLWKN